MTYTPEKSDVLIYSYPEAAKTDVLIYTYPEHKNWRTNIYNIRIYSVFAGYLSKTGIRQPEMTGF